MTEMLQRIKNALGAVKQGYSLWHNLEGGKHLVITIISALVFGGGAVIGNLIHNSQEEEPAPVAAVEEEAGELELADNCKSG
jgi:hypothetical protein